ncbi:MULTISPECIES: hypothetical protein [Exiguobacterium]|uniref:hypothetical protein n=1 Tax=Exiguobacterium TaxID=33986 RepID=UPI001BE8ACDD|nr:MULTISPECIES: hypothetical protein [Exiguobacterium]MCT4777174.1 hypothetical protein [Exiguobacterium aquaticum]MCT4787894.1 hypothetical protein [Exiguobacterium mexicanum]
MEKTLRWSVLRTVLFCASLTYIFGMPYYLGFIFYNQFSIELKDSLALGIALFAILTPIIIKINNDLDRIIKSKIYKPMNLRIKRVKENSFPKEVELMINNKDIEIVDYMYVGKTEIAIKYYKN